MARPNDNKNHAVWDAEAEASSHSEATSNTQPNIPSEISEQLLPTLVPMQQAQQQILQILMNSKMNEVKEPTLVAEPTIDDPVQGETFVANADNLSIAGR